MPAQLFVSYTREAGPADARRLAGDLQTQLGIEPIPGLADSPDQGSIDKAEIVLAVVGPGWLANPDDPFATQVGAALSRRIPVVPVLIHNAELPGRDALPDLLKPLLDHHPGLTIEIPSDFYWEVSTTRLARWLQRIDAERRKRLKTVQDATANRIKLEQELDRTRQQVTEAESAVTEWAQKREQLGRSVQSATETVQQRRKEVDPGRAGSSVRVFLSYGSETSGDARKLESDLKERLERAVVYSTERIPEGADPQAVIGERIGRCDLLLAVIGPSWTAPSDGAGGTEPRLEVEQALKRKLPVIPVLTQHASKPERAALGDELKSLADLPALELMVQYWSDGVDALVKRVSETEQELRRREKAMDDATEQLHGLEREAKRSREAHDKALAGLERNRAKVTDLERRLTRAREEQERLGQERDDQNRSFLDGPPAIEPEHERKPPSRTVMIAAAVVVLILIIIVIAAH
jgi:hypothetical protein